MREHYFDIAFTPSVAATQEANGSRAAYARRAAAPRNPDAGLGEMERAFLAQQDGFFLASQSETGWPYVQFRGGPRGFLAVTGPRTLAFADYRGNRQYISAGNVAQDGRVALIVMDYARQARLKIFGRLTMKAVGDTPEAAAALARAAPGAVVERIAVIEVAAFDWNCPQHITPRYTMEEVEAAVAPLRQRIAELEAQRAGKAAAGEPATGSGADDQDSGAPPVTPIVSPTM